MGKILSISLDKLDDPIFDSPYEIYKPKRFSSKEKVKKKPKDMIVPKIDISPLLVPRREVPIIPKELQVKRDPDLDKGLGNFYKKQFRFDE